MSGNGDGELIELRAELRGADFERLIVVASDLEYLIALPRDRLLTHTEVRLAAGILRRLLVDDEFGAVFKAFKAPRKVQPAVEATYLDDALNKWPIVSRRFRLSWYPSLGSALLTLRLRVCDDSPGELAILIVQRRRVDGRLVASGRSVRRDLAPDRSCRLYEVTRSVRRKFFRAGVYSVTVRVRDNGGLASAAVRTAWPAPG